MSDNVQLDAGSGGETIKTVLKAGAHVAVSAIDVGNHDTDSVALVGNAGVYMPVTGAVADNTATSNNPVLVGAKYLATGTAVDDGDAAHLLTDSFRQLRTVLFSKDSNQEFSFHTADFDTDSANPAVDVDFTSCIGIAVAGSGGAVALTGTTVGSDTGLDVNIVNTSITVDLGTTDTDNLEAIKDAVEIIDNAVQTDKISIAGRTTIGTPSTATALLVDALGHLQVDVLSSTLNSIGNVSVAVNSGTKDDGTQRVVIANDDPNVSKLSDKVAIAGRTNISSAASATALLCDANGNLKVELASSPTVSIDGSNNEVSLGTDVVHIAGRTAIATPATATALLVDSAGHLQVDVLSSTITNIGSTAVAVNSGNKTDGTQRVVIATDDVNISSLSSVVETANSAITNPDTATKVSMIGAVVDNVLAAASTPYADGDAAPLKVTATGALHVDAGEVSLGAGTEAIGKLAENSGVDIGDVDVTSISDGSNLIGDVGIQGRTTGGLSMHSKLDYVNTPVDVKSSAGTVYGITVFNMTASPFYIKFYDETTSVNRATDTPVLRFAVPANASSSGAGFVFNVPQGLAFGNRIQYAITTGVADTDTSGISSGNAVVNIAYK